MADMILDMVFEVVETSLTQNDLMAEVGLIKDYANFCMILKLKNWTDVNVKYEPGNNPLKLEELGNNPLKLEEPGNNPLKLNEPGNHPLKLDEDEDRLDGAGAEYSDCVDQIKAENESGNFVREKSYRDDATAAKTKFRLADCSVGLVRFDGAKKPEEEEDLRKTQPPSMPSNEASLAANGKKSSNRSKKLESKNPPASRGRPRLTAGSKLKKRFKCEFCDYIADNRRRMTRHTSIHFSEKPVACLLCDYTCKRDDLLKKHMQKHLRKKPYECDECEYACSRSGQLSRHKRWRHGDLAGRYSCEYCDFATTTPHYLQKHEQRIHLRQRKLFKCQRCRFKTVMEERYLEHVEAHRLNSSFICSVCGANFLTQKDYYFHARKHARGPVERKVACPKCDKMFYTAPLLKSHMYLHTGVKEFRCRFCGVEFGMVSTLLRHHRKKHPGEEAFDCRPCEFQTSSYKEHCRHVVNATHLEKVASVASVAGVVAT